MPQNQQHLVWLGALRCTDGVHPPGLHRTCAVCQLLKVWGAEDAGGGERGGVGVVPIPPDLVAAALGEGTLALLAPQPLSLSLSLTAVTSGAPAAEATCEGAAPGI